MKFDTRDKKPKLYDLMAITGIVVLILADLFVNGGAGSFAPANVILLLYYIVAIALLLIALKGQLEYNPYSYNTIYYTGFSIFTFSVLVTHIIWMISFANSGGEASMMNVVHILVNSAEMYMMLTFPFVLVFSIALCISNISLIRHEGFSFVNVLGIILSFLLVGGTLFLYKYDFYVMGSEQEIMFHELRVAIFSSVYLYYECMLIGTIIADLIAARHIPERNKDFMIVLGCAIREDGTPTPLLKGRIDTA